MPVKLRQEFISLLKEDVEFRYTVAGLLGLEEILRRLDKHSEELVKLREDMNKLREDMVKGFQRHDEEIAKLREDMVKGFERHDAEIARLREDMNKLREDMNKGFQRHDEEITRLREDMVKGFQRHDEEIAKLREDMVKGFALLERHVSALGARWGLMSEEAFREGLKGILEKEFEVVIERWSGYDDLGSVYGYPSLVEVDVAVHDEKTILIEVSSHVRPSEVSAFKRKAEAYERLTGKKPNRLMIVTPYAEDEAKDACKKHGIELYTKV